MASDKNVGKQVQFGWSTAVFMALSPRGQDQWVPWTGLLGGGCVHTLRSKHRPGSISLRVLKLRSMFSYHLLHFSRS